MIIIIIPSKNLGNIGLQMLLWRNIYINKDMYDYYFILLYSKKFFVRSKSEIKIFNFLIINFLNFIFSS